MGVGEFQIFQLGYEDWYGREAEPSDLDAPFFAYLLENQISAWARHYARKIIKLDDSGELDANAAFFHRFDAASMKVAPIDTFVTSKFGGIFPIIAFAALVAITMGGAIFLLHGTIPEAIPCIFPPCPWVQ